MSDPTFEPTTPPLSGPSASSSIDDASVAEDARGEAGTLEGEGEDAHAAGVMYTASTWVVPGWVKAATFWLSLVSLVALAYHETDKRLTFRRLLIDGVVEPESFGGKAAPPFSLPEGPDGAPVALESYRGQWVLVNFWATWCAPCRDEMPSLEMLHRRTKDQGLAMLAISVDDEWSQVNRFFGDTRPGFTVLWDKERRASSAFGTHKFPETFLIDPEGNVAAQFIGSRDWYNQGTVQYFEEVLAGKRKPVS